jgi:hypothetical protein
VRFAHPSTLSVGSRRDDRLVRRHLVVMTGLRPRTTYWVSVGSGTPGSAASRPTTLRTSAPGVALQTSLDFLAGRLTGALRLSDLGFGALALPQGGSGTFVSAVQDARQKITWTSAVIQRSGTPARLTLSVRTGDRPVPDRTWSTWRRVTPRAIDQPGRYLQIRLRLTAPLGSPARVTAIGVTHDGRAPAAVGELS